MMSRTRTRARWRAWRRMARADACAGRCRRCRLRAARILAPAGASGPPILVFVSSTFSSVGRPSKLLDGTYTYTRPPTQLGGPSLTLRPVHDVGQSIILPLAPYLNSGSCKAGPPLLPQAAAPRPPAIVRGCIRHHQHAQRFRLPRRSCCDPPACMQLPCTHAAAASWPRAQALRCPARAPPHLVQTAHGCRSPARRCDCLGLPGASGKQAGVPPLPLPGPGI
jgi:hypothetical protein